MPLFDFTDSEVDTELVHQARAQRQRERRMFAWCSECMSNGHRPGCPEQTEEDDDVSDS